MCNEIEKLDKERKSKEDRANREAYYYLLFIKYITIKLQMQIRYKEVIELLNNKFETLKVDENNKYFVSNLARTLVDIEENDNVLYDKLQTAISEIILETM